jgi:glycosyltransferase involved in cell wall biosynthesis
MAKGADWKHPLRWVSYREKLREIAMNRRFQRMVVVSRFMKGELLRNGFDETRIEIHPPVPRMGEWNLRSNFSERNLILYVGQIIRGKGVDVLLKSLARLQTRFECLILGDGNHRRYCEALTRRLGLSERVQFRGFVPQDQLKSYYQECTVVALSSVWPEPIATVGLEVLRYGLPVVAFDVGGIREWLIDGYNGFLVPWMDRAEYARRLEQLLLDKALARRLGEQGLGFINERFDFGKYISGLERMFERVREETPRPAPGRCGAPVSLAASRATAPSADSAEPCLR